MNNRDIVDSGAPIRIGESQRDPGETRWGMLLALFMRVVAFLWILQGLEQWRVVLFVPFVLFDHVTMWTGVAIVYFAVMDLLAAVGLWLATPWGGVLWLLVVLSQIAVAFSLRNFFGGGLMVVALDVVLIGLYLLLTYEAGRDRESRSPPRQKKQNKPIGAWRGAQARLSHLSGRVREQILHQLERLGF